jgi:hypothetical protein
MIDQKEDLTLQNPSKDVEEAQVSTTLQDEGMISKESKNKAQRPYSKTRY